MTEVAFLVNPASANGRAGRRWPELAHRAAYAGLEGPAYLSERPGQLVQLAQEAADHGAELLVVVGGDGTVNEVARGLLERYELGQSVPEIAVIPQGTGRDFARTFRLPRDTVAALETARADAGEIIDAARVSYRTWDGGTGNSYFANVASAGMSGAIAERANTTTEGAWGEGVVSDGDTERVLTLAAGRDVSNRRRRRAAGPDARRSRRQLPLFSAVA